MRFGIYCEMQTPPGKSHYDQTWEIMRQIEHADESGFDVYSVIDHHFFQKFSISANPLAFDAITGLPHAIASSATFPKLSSSDGAAMKRQC